MGGEGARARDRAGDRLAVVQRARPGALLLPSRLGWPRRADGGVPGPPPRLTPGVRRLDSGPVQRAKVGPRFFLPMLSDSLVEQFRVRLTALGLELADLRIGGTTNRALAQVHIGWTPTDPGSPERRDGGWGSAPRRP